ncbi:molecular chaperone HtpG [Roseospira marina]|uniref:Chaperone protein HtpG n=1 Tax=Roseospira marina TaxID=140057 RepID=A0A5M6IHF5_9PROT|nr:molecular chaperone HtpG [Roseospira marina]KAA5607377.1 molecular chaperone HtpG [Roseospira marina]MBB4312454.1 molecular chaperone HtpG [Roseospira marina]MBB5085530.1 molecular chaperone HtpG [Roseospira marina]
MTEERLSFQAEVSKLLDIVVHSLYSDRRIFLRELISNASDACDKLRYEALTNPALREGSDDFRITLKVDADAKTIEIADNGIGMNRQDLIDNLGTIARSGTEAFVKQLQAAGKSGDASQIGQFGVGFYSSFMVANTVEVFTRRAGESEGWHWTSDGGGEFSIGEAEVAAPGTRIVLHLREDASEFLEAWRLKSTVKTYSDHIAIPVVLLGTEEKDGKTEDTAETLNEASALWTRPRSEITPEQYKEFYHHVGHAFDEPWHTVHFKAEGAIEYTGLLFIPSQKPFDLFQPERKTHVKLYVNRVFITDEAPDLLPSYLRFMRGIVDSSDLPLNVSREMLQHNPVLRKIQGGLVKRILSDLKKRAEANAEDYAAFWDIFGAVLKEGIYEDHERRQEVLELARFRSSTTDGWVSLADYKARMKTGQDTIYYITGDDPEVLKRSPQLEGFRAKGVEVLLLTDPVDEFWINSVPDFQDTPLKSAASSVEGLDEIAGPDASDETTTEDKAPADQIETLTKALKETLGDAVKDVRASSRLKESPVCLVAEDGGMSLHLERMLKQAGQAGIGLGSAAGRILEINPAHPLIKGMAARTAQGTPDSLADMGQLLLDQARIVEGEAPADPVAFARRLSTVMAGAL